MEPVGRPSAIWHGRPFDLSSAGPRLRTLGRNVGPREHDQKDQDRIGSDAYDVRNPALPLNGLFAHGMSLSFGAHTQLAIQGTGRSLS